MICFPLDNTEYSADALGAWFGSKSRGITSADHCTTTTNGDMSVTVSPGLAWLRAGDYWGVVALDAEAQKLTISTADGSLPRIDAVCIRLNKNQNRAEMIVKKGRAASQPSVAPPVRDLNYDEIYIATILVRAGATSILESDITDQRLNDDYCGIARDGIAGLPESHASTHASAGSDPLTPAMIGAAPAPYYLSVTIQPSAWGSSGPPYIATMTRLSNVQTGDYMIAGLTPISSDVNDRMAEHNAWRCVSEITPGPAALYLRCLETRPDRPLSLILVGWHTTSTAGYCYLTGHASSSGGGTPDAHASTHAAGGSDPITPALIGAATSGHNHTGTYAPISHAATATTYGKATSTSYGHVKLSSATNSASGLSDGTAATPAAVKAAYDLAASRAPANQGIPAGGATGQVLVKRSGTDYDTNWATPTGGGGGGTPDAHASTHALGGSDPITPAAIGAAISTHNHSGTYAPVSHAASANTYGAGSGTNYGHIKLSAATNSTLGVSGGTAATPSAVKAAYDLAAGKADADHNHDDRYALIGHTHSGSGAGVEYITITAPLAGWDAGVPCTQTISVAGVAATDYITAKYTSNAINTNERVADHAAYCCVTDGTPTPGGVLLTCWHERPTRDIRMVLRVEHGGTTGYMVMTGQARPSGGAKTANGSVIASEQAISVTGLGFKPSMVTFIGSSGKTTVTSGYGADTGSTTIARYADASNPGNVGTFSPSEDGFVLTVQGAADPKSLNVSWYAVGD